MEINDSTRIIDMTLGELKNAIREVIGREQVEEVGTDMVKGISGIMELFQCSAATANRLKNGVIADAVQQCAKGHTIMVDKKKAIALYNQHREI